MPLNPVVYGETMGAKDIRWTGVPKMRGGNRVVVQSHGPLAANMVTKETE